MSAFKFVRFIFSASAFCCATLFAAGPESELHERVMLNSRQDNAAGANLLAGAMQDCAGRIAAGSRSIVTRRAFELVLTEAQDAIATFVSPEAMKVFAGYLPRLAPDAAITLLFALKTAPAHADVDAAAAKMLAPGMDFRVRTALMELLGAHHYAPAVDKIALGLNPLENPSIQIAACRALAQIPDKKALPDLIKYMNALSAKGGRYKYEATAALRALSGEHIEANPALWSAWWEQHKKDFAPDASKAAAPDFNFELSEKQELEYYEVPVVENRLVIILDCSGSMSMGGKPNRIDSAKKELKGFINSLNDKQLFNLVCFSSTLRRWKKDNGLLPGTDANKKDAIKFLDTQHEGGGTQTMLAMEDVLRDIATMHGCETVYLVTDGNPNPWAKDITAEQQERLLHWINQPLKIRINTIGIYSITKQDQDMMASLHEVEDVDKMKKFLIDIAENNDGVYREVGKDGSNKVVKTETKKQQAAREKEEKEKADKAAKEKEEKEKAAKEAAANPVNKDAPDVKKDDPPAKEEPVLKLDKKEQPPKKDTPAPDKNTPVIEAPKSDKDIDLPFKIERRKEVPPEKKEAKKDETE